MIRSFGGSICTHTINTKKDGWINLTPSSFLKIVSSRQRVKPFLCDFYFTINHIFSENLIGIPQVCQKIFSVNINYFNQFFGIFWHFLVSKKVNRLFNSCTKLSEILLVSLEVEAGSARCVCVCVCVCVCGGGGGVGEGSKVTPQKRQASKYPVLLGLI